MKLLHFAKDGREYIVLTDETDESMFKDFARPGFGLIGTANVQDDNGKLPLETELEPA